MAEIKNPGNVYIGDDQLNSTLPPDIVIRNDDKDGSKQVIIKIPITMLKNGIKVLTDDDETEIVSIDSGAFYKGKFIFIPKKIIRDGTKITIDYKLDAFSDRHLTFTKVNGGIAINTDGPYFYGNWATVWKIFTY